MVALTLGFLAVIGTTILFARGHEIAGLIIIGAVAVIDKICAP